jgi:septal ring factor EnvC (AmiA/AmiB activator)
MDDKLENIFTNFANSQEETLKEMGMSKESFIEQAKEWSKTEEGKLEIQKFILQQEILDLEKQVSDLNNSINKKQKSIDEINIELSNLSGD